MDKADLHSQIEGVGLAIRVCQQLADRLSDQQAQGAHECVINLRLEISRLLALMTKEGRHE